MESVIERSFHLNLNVMYCMGYLPEKTTSIVYFIYGILLLIVATIPNMVFITLYFWNTREIDVLDLGFHVSAVVETFCCGIKVLSILLNAERTKNCLCFIEIGFNVLSKYQTSIIDDAINVCRRNSFVFFTFLLIDMFCWLCVNALSARKGQLPISWWLPFDPALNTFVFYFIYAVMILGVFYVGLAAAALDTLMTGLMYHASAQLKILKNKLQTWNYSMLKENIAYHQTIIIFIKEIQACFTWTIFSNFIGSSVVICFFCFQTAKLEPGSVYFCYMLISLSTVLIQVLFYCYYGSLIFEESNTLPTEAFMSDWYKHSLSSKKLLITFMQRSNVPLTITAGKLLDVSLETFMLILKRSYTLLAVLQDY